MKRKYYYYYLMGVADGRAEKLRMGNRQEGARDLELAMID